MSVNQDNWTNWPKITSSLHYVYVTTEYVTTATKCAYVHNLCFIACLQTYHTCAVYTYAQQVHYVWYMSVDVYGHRYLQSNPLKTNQQFQGKWFVKSRNLLSQYICYKRICYQRMWLYSICTVDPIILSHTSYMKLFYLADILMFI